MILLIGDLLKKQGCVQRRCDVNMDIIPAAVSFSKDVMTNVIEEATNLLIRASLLRIVK